MIAEINHSILLIHHTISLQELLSISVHCPIILPLSSINCRKCFMSAHTTIKKKCRWCPKRKKIHEEKHLKKMLTPKNRANLGGRGEAFWVRFVSSTHQKKWFVSFASNRLWMSQMICHKFSKNSHLCVITAEF